MNANPTLACRLCGGTATRTFDLQIMGRHRVGYYACSVCHALQTEAPWWLEEAYADATRYTDTFLGHRILALPPLTYTAARAAGLVADCRLLDWGGGNGLITRLLRDLGFDAYSYDLYDKPTCCPGFSGEPGDRYAVITAFEVLEHLAEPGRELRSLFACRPELVVASTGIYEGQGPDWTYLAPYAGRHVFFFSRQAMDWVARQHGYEALVRGSYTVFHRPGLSAARRRLLALALSARGQRLVRAGLSLRPPAGRARADWDLMRVRVNDFNPPPPEKTP